MMINNDFPMKLKQAFDERMVGQQSYKKIISLRVFQHIKHDISSPTLVIGPSGCGKTYLISLLKRFIEDYGLSKRYSVMVFNTENLTPAGFEGQDSRDIMTSWKRTCMETGNSSCRGLIYLDEIDKTCRRNFDSGHANVNAFVQAQLMNILCGIKYNGVDTSKILFVLGGAFTDLESLERERSKQIGFIRDCEQVGEAFLEEDRLRNMLVSIGAEREFIGRISSIIRLKGLTKTELAQVLLHPTQGVIAKKQKLFEQEGLSLKIDRKVIAWLLNEVIKEDLGARSCENILNNLLGACEYDMLENGYKSVYIHEGVVLRGEIPIFTKTKTV